MWTKLHTHTNTHLHKQTYAHIYTQIPTHTHKHAHTQLHTYKNTHLYTNTHMHKHTNTQYKQICLQTHISTQTHTCTQASTYTQTHICTQRHKHILHLGAWKERQFPNTFAALNWGQALAPVHLPALHSWNVERIHYWPIDSVSSTQQHLKHHQTFARFCRLLWMSALPSQQLL